MIKYVRQYCFVGCFPAVAMIGFDPVSYTVMEGDSVSVMVRVFSGQLQTQVSANISTPASVTGITMQHSTHVANIQYTTIRYIPTSFLHLSSLVLPPLCREGEFDDTQYTFLSQ